MKFVCDEQLGRLAKWLRIRGFDAFYQCPISDDDLIRRAHSEGRILLTRDQRLSAKTLLKVVVLKETHYAKQLAELSRKIKLPRSRMFTRCLECNQLLERIGRESARGKVPLEVYNSYKDFFACPSCRKIFWEGTHVRNTERRLM